MSVAELQTYLRRPLVVFDCETTGFYYDGGDEIIELAAEKVIEGEVTETFHRIIRPTRPIALSATAIHGLDDEYVHDHGVWPKEAFPQFTNFIEDAVLVGHNIRRFDYPFIATHYLKLDLPVPKNDLLDTLELSRAFLTLPNHKLGTIATHFSISTYDAHRAAADVAMTRQVLFAIAGVTGFDMPPKHATISSR